MKGESICYLNIVVRLFANTRRSMGNSKITEDQQKIARYAKAMGHPIRMYVLELLSSNPVAIAGTYPKIYPLPNLLFHNI